MRDPLDNEIVEMAARRIAIELRRRNFVAAHAAVDAVAAELDREPASGDELADQPLAEHLPLRIANALEEFLGCLYIRDLRGRTYHDLQRTPGIGTHAVRQILDLMHAANLDDDRLPSQPR